MPAVKDIIKELSAYDPDDELLVIYWDKELCSEWISTTVSDIQEEYNLTDDEVNQIVKEAWSDVTNQTYDTEDTGNSIQSDFESFIFDKLKKFDTESTKELDQQLWEA